MTAAFIMALFSGAVSKHLSVTELLTDVHPIFLPLWRGMCSKVMILKGKVCLSVFQNTSYTLVLLQEG